MKKTLQFLLVFSLVLTIIPAYAESDTGIWGRYAYVDEFKQGSIPNFV